MRRRPLHAKGFTLIEALTAAAILAMTVTAITFPFASGARNELHDARMTLAASLAQEMMEEILSKPFADPGGSSNLGPEPGETSRSLFDNMDDYHAYTEAAGQIRAADGALMTDRASAGLSRSVTCAYMYVSGQDTQKTATYLRITVTVQYQGQTLARLTRLAYAH